MSLSRALGVMHRTLGGWPVAVRLAVKLRNQCNSIIKHQLGLGPDLETNGEAWLVRSAAPALSTFVDVGANVGEWTATVLAAAPDGKGLCFEPARLVAEQLRQRLRGHTNVEVVEAALSDASGEQLFFESADASELSSLAVAPAPGARSYPVRVSTLDQEVAQRGWERVDFLKVDAEGYDLRVLEGARELLAGQRVGLIQFEYGHVWPHTGSTLAAALRFLQGFGYTCRLLGPKGLYPVAYEWYGEHFSYANYVAIAPDQMERLKPFLRT